MTVQLKNTKVKMGTHEREGTKPHAAPDIWLLGGGAKASSKRQAK